MAQDFITRVNGKFKRIVAIITSAGAADSGKIPALNTSGVLDPTIVNSTVTSAGAADAGKHVRLDASGAIDTTVLPPGVGPDTESMPASEALSAGAYVNIYDASGTTKCRNADATAVGKEANGFVLSAVSSGGTAIVYRSGANTALTGLTRGADYWLSTTPGQGTTTAPSTTGNWQQLLGKASTPTRQDFTFQEGVEF